MDAEDAIEAERLSEESAQAPAEPDELDEPDESEEMPAPSGEEPVEFEAMALPDIEATGHAEVDAALERLQELAELPTGAHADLYDGVHQRLQDALAQIDNQDAGR